MTPNKDSRVARPSAELSARHYTLTRRTGHSIRIPRYWVPGLAGLAGVLLLLLGGTLLSYADTSPDARPALLRVLPTSFWFPETSSQAAPPPARAPVAAPAPSLPSQPRPAAAVASAPSEPRSAAAVAPTPTSLTLSRDAYAPPPLVGRAESDWAARGPLPPTTSNLALTDSTVAASSPTLAAIALPPPNKTALPSAAFEAVPAFGVTAAPTTKPLVLPTSTLPPSPTTVPTAPPSPSAVPTSQASRSAVPTSVPSPSAQPTLVVAAVASPSRPTPTVAPPATAQPPDYKLGDTVAITEVLKGFAFTGHWPNSTEGVYATDWYPRSASQSCTNSHRMPLAVPVAGTWRLASQMAPMGGTQYTLIGELDDGNSVGFTHVDRDVKTGRVAANTVVGFVGISGLESFDAAGLNPSHVHVTWNSRIISGWDGGAGNRPARDFFGQYGFQVEIRDAASGASPQHYMMRQGCGGMQGAQQGTGRPGSRSR
jgi:hypothetical protein